MNVMLHPVRIPDLIASFIAKPLQLLIAGTRVNAKSGKTFAVFDPATGQPIAEVAEGDAADIFDSFLDKLTAKTQALKLGDPLDEATDIGTIINEKRLRKVCDYVDEGLKRKDARLVFGGLPPKDGPLSEGYFAVPIVFADTSNDWWLAREEIFGPVLVAIPWRDEADAMGIANDSHYGLAAYIWTHDIGSALRTAHAIESGWVQVNQGQGQQPGHSYGGYKQSGIGREFSPEGMLDSFTQRKNVTVNLSTPRRMM
jgi:acyl-CoA reductase-like NAD-dependent aldehyde dehydrogenase